MTDQFLRAYRLTVGTTEIDARQGIGSTSMRIAFQVERDATRTPNSAEIAIWNLSSGSRLALSKSANVPVHLEAGYVGDVGTVFLGDLRKARSVREGPDFITRVSGGDGEAKVRTARLSKTFGAGTPVGDVLSSMAKALGLNQGNIAQFRGAKLANGSSTITRPLTLHGAVFDELEAFTRSCGLTWSVQDSTLQLRAVDEPVGETQGPLLRADSGLIGTPQVEVETKVKKNGGTILGQTVVCGVCLLRADLVPGRPFRVESEAFDGDLICRSTLHKGDTHSTTDWYVEWTGVPY